MVFLFSTRAAGVCASGFMNTAKLKNTFVKPTKRFSERFRTILEIWILQEIRGVDGKIERLPEKLWRSLVLKRRQTLDKKMLLEKKNQN